MLPRCARAVETGYTVFTTDLVYGHYLGDRRASQEMRILKYADRGFGILFPAAILAATEIDFAARGDDHRPWHRRDNPQEPEVVTGKKAVLRLAYLARDTVHRFFIGPTEASLLALEDDDYYEDEDLQTMKEWTPPSEPRGVDFCQLDGEPQYRGGAIGNRNGLKMFESFMRMVAAWTFDVEGKIKYVSEPQIMMVTDDAQD